MSKLNQPKILFITPSYFPTYCGIGNFVYKINNILKIQGYSTLVITNLNQNLFKKQNLVSDKLNDVSKIDIKLINIFKILHQIREYKPNIINLQYNSAEAGRKSFQSFLPFIIKLFFPSILIQVTIHEFAVYKLSGKIRHTLPTIIADKVFFSDQKQLNSWLKFTKSLFKNKAAVFPIGSNLLIETTRQDNTLNRINDKIIICFHGLIQPKNGLEYLLEALKSIPKYQYELHILGDFKLLIDYGNQEENILKYQVRLLEIINQNDLSVNIHGDIDPAESKFRDILNLCNVYVCPDSEGITSRRTSFWNVFLQCSLITICSFDENNSESYFKEYLEIVRPKYSHDILAKLIEISSFSEQQIVKIIEKQELLKKKFEPENYSKEIIKLIIND